MRAKQDVSIHDVFQCCTLLRVRALLPPLAARRPALQRSENEFVACCLP